MSNTRYAKIFDKMLFLGVKPEIFRALHAGLVTNTPIFPIREGYFFRLRRNLGEEVL